MGTIILTKRNIVTGMVEELTSRLAAAVRAARMARGMSVQVLADASAVSRTMISKIERGEVQPTAALLAKLSGALAITLSELIARAEGDHRRLVRAADQPVWSDPETGYLRRAVSPPAGGPLELVEVELPGQTEISMPASTYEFIHQQIWVLEGRLEFHEGDEVHDLAAGDCLQLGAPATCRFVNPVDRPCRYVVALAKRVGLS